MKNPSLMAAALLAAGLTAPAFAAGDVSANSTSNGCKVVHLKPGESPPGGMSTSISAGNGSVSGQTTVGRGDNGVSVSSGGGAVSSTAGGSAASSVSTSSDGRTTTVTTSDGGCTVYMRDQK